jgi:acetylornithine/succinyldiaminopimelate/putrescine aminotransferase
MMLRAEETHERVDRFAPLLFIEKEMIDWALPAIRKVLDMPQVQMALRATPASKPAMV